MAVNRITSCLYKLAVSPPCLSPRYLTTSASLGFEMKSNTHFVKNVQKQQLKSGETQGTEGEYSTAIETSEASLYPTKDTPYKLYNGVQYQDLPIIHLKCTKNHTMISVTDFEGNRLDHHSCQLEGFKNARKRTAVAAQVTAQALGERMIKKRIKTCRLKVQGLGQGRMAAVTGLSNAGVEIVSVSDHTPIKWNQNPRPKKARRV